MLGIVGGIAPGSTIEYYRRFIEGYRARTGGAYPSFLITSIDLPHMLSLVEANNRSEAVAFLGGEVKRLATAGADVALFASNTPHLFFREIQAVSPIPLISIVEAVKSAAKARGLRRLGLLGTRFIMESGMYQQVFAESAIEVVTPQAADIESIHARYMSELVVARFEEPTRRLFRDVIKRLRVGKQIDGVILGGTEIPLLIPDASFNGLPLLDTTQIHVDRAIDVVLQGAARGEEA